MPTERGAATPTQYRALLLAITVDVDIDGNDLNMAMRC